MPITITASDTDGTSISIDESSNNFITPYVAQNTLSSTNIITSTFLSSDGTTSFTVSDDGVTFTDLTTHSAGATINGTLTVNDNSFEIVSTDAGATVNPIISLFRNSASPAVNDDLGAIQFYGEDDGDNKTLYAQIHGRIEDETGGTEDGRIHFSCASSGSLEDPTMTLTRSSLKLSANNDFILEQNAFIRFEGTSNNSNETTFYVEDPTADRSVNLPDGSGVLEIGALATGAVITATSIAHATFSTYKGQKIVFTGSSDCTIGLPDAASGDIGATWTVCNAGSANVIFDLDASAAQTLKILTGAAVTTVGTDNPHIVPGGEINKFFKNLLIRFQLNFQSFKTLKFNNTKINIYKFQVPKIKFFSKQPRAYLEK